MTVHKYISKAVQLPTEERLSSVTCSRAMKSQFLEQKNLHITNYLGTTFPVLVTATDRQAQGSLKSSSHLNLRHPTSFHFACVSSSSRKHDFSSSVLVPRGKIFNKGNKRKMSNVQLFLPVSLLHLS